ncbi:MAG TPA: hypothetical protein VFS65_02125, partial [Candidatus Saccharimonadales bacterium]|nr:hypothetical protein [Candidatus Saccharimonadales bacterium]
PTTTVSVDDTQTIVNNIALAAESGSAAVLGNTRAGSATTGDANTNIVIFNLSGHQIVASNSLLVFVNVLGTWVGVIVDAPVGATSAAIGNEVTNSVVNAPDLTLKSQTNSQIVNTINLSSKSGDATVAGNTAAGSATTGQATASANVANIAGSQLSMSGWFGVLFINVFGSWYGSFGIDTSYGNQPQNNSTGTHTNPDKVVPAEKTMRVIEFIPHAASAATVISSNNEGTPPQVTQLQPGSVLSATTNGTPAVVGISGEYSDFRLPIVIGAMGLIGLSALGMKRLLFHGGQPPIA